MTAPPRARWLRPPQPRTGAAPVAPSQRGASDGRTPHLLVSVGDAQFIDGLRNPSVALWLAGDDGRRIYALVGSDTRFWPPAYVEGGSLAEAEALLGPVAEAIGDGNHAEALRRLRDLATDDAAFIPTRGGRADLDALIARFPEPEAAAPGMRR